MKFFLAFEPRDFIYRDWTPEDDLWDSPKGPRQYLWEVYDPPPIDGVLVSRSKLTGETLAQVLRNRIKAFLRYDGLVFGDCGAFTYVNKPEPPYQPSDTLSYYDKCGFDLGATIDHLIPSKTRQDKERRREITIKNAEVMFREWDTNYRNGWKLVGVAQGWDKSSYLDSVQRLLELGFENIALGSMARRPTQVITELLAPVSNLIQQESKRIELHLFGVWRPSAVNDFVRFGVRSFDTATILRQAWLRWHQGYYLDNSRYSTLRVPVKSENEREIITAFRSYATRQTESISEETLDQAVELVRERARKANLGVEKLKPMYLRTLTERPWEKCHCPLCTKYGVDMLIFRGNERNMRRGFHNVWHMYRYLQEQKELISKEENLVRQTSST